MRGSWLAMAALGYLTLVGPSSAQQTSGDSAVPTNEWPDPNLFIRDTSAPIAAMNDALTGPIPAIRVTGYTVGSRTVTINTPSTANLLVGQYVSLAPPCDPALRATILQVQSIVPDTSFTATLEYPSGVPVASTPCAATLVQSGNVSGATGGNITSNLQRFANGRVWPGFWISNRPAHTGLLRSGVNVLVVRKVTDGLESVYWQTSAQTVSMAGVKRAVGAAVYVASGPGANARAFINDGAIHYGPVTATARARTWVTANDEVPRASTVFAEGVMLDGPAGSTFVIGEFESVPYPTLLPDGSFSTPPRQTVLALASISPYIGVDFTLPQPSGGFDVNMGQASGLAISGGVAEMIGNLEGQCTTFPQVLSVNSGASPTIFGPIVHQVLDATGKRGNPGYYGFASGAWPLRNNHLTMYGSAGAVWNYVSWDIHAFLLLAGP